MRQIKAQPLDREKFRRYGDFINTLDDAALAAASVNPRGFFADVLQLNFNGTLPPTLSVNSLKKPEKQVVFFVENHKCTAEGIMPVDGDVIMYVGIPSRGEPSGDNIEAFIVPKGTFVVLNPHIVHGGLIALQDEVHALCLLPGRTFANDFNAKILPEEERIEIVL